ncbi:nuclear transport factor 2 family protein [Mycolicibacterium sp. 050232]|uniref:nuclear transport factor 2 family protein n=1 Tax=Mycolicibacterium sp. 050232 TaxID=3113982 RepID=UPI002E2C2508|nr:nuclear transport factor 2 family protein [Mycolicibacterium sp. 050232]MED5811095.1 nuclear transport factor 2 family protein [Mycolicibacterium sp. 050232]
MIYRWLARKKAIALWAKLSDQRIDEIPLADDVHFQYLGDHALAVDLRGADAEREWLRDRLFRQFPDLRFEVEAMVIEGGPWSTRIATSYAATRQGQIVYRGVNIGRVVWGKIVEERILPDTQALAVALGRGGLN